MLSRRVQWRGRCKLLIRVAMETAADQHWKFSMQIQSLLDVQTRIQPLFFLSLILPAMMQQGTLASSASVILTGSDMMVY